MTAERDRYGVTHAQRAERNTRIAARLAAQRAAERGEKVSANNPPARADAARRRLPTVR